MLIHDKQGRFAGGSYWTGRKGDPRISGENHGNWQGDLISYSQLHRWAKKQFPSPMECWICGASNCKLNMACINKIYTRSDATWARLCIRCHRILDEHPFSDRGMDSRRKTVVELASKGLTTNQIAVAVNVSARTVVRDLAYIATTKKPPGRELPRHGLEEEVK